MPLYGRVYTNDLTTPVFLDEFSRYVEDIALNWALHGGFQSAEVILNCNYTKAYLYYRHYIGMRCVIDDHVGDRPVVEGFITSARMRRSGVTFTVNGFWFRHSDQLYAFDDTAQDDEQGVLTYNPAANSFQDDCQDFSEWESGGDPALYEITVTNSDGTYSWGFLGAAFTTDNADDSVYVYTNSALGAGSINDTTFAFAGGSPGTITDSNSGFVAAGFVAGQTIAVSGTDSNDGTYTISNVIASTLTLSDDDELTAEPAGDDVTIYSVGWNGTSPTGKTPSSYIIQLSYNYKTTSDCIKEALTTDVPSMSSNQANIDETNTVIGFYETPYEEGGMYPAEFIEKMASMSDSSNNQWNYWIASNNYYNGRPQKPIAYFKAQTNDNTYDWNIESTSVSDDEIASREMFELRNHIKVIFRNMDDEDLLDITSAASNADSIATYWQREAVVSGGDNTTETAEYYRDLYLNDYKDPVLGLPIELRSATIDDSHGRPYPLWAPIKYNKAYFRQMSLFPEYGVTSFNRDGIFTGQAMSMEYSYRDNSLRIVIDTESNELAAVIARLDAFV